jgi:nucleoid DNA-binding protein
MLGLREQGMLVEGTPSGLDNCYLVLTSRKPSPLSRIPRRIPSGACTERRIELARAFDFASLQMHRRHRRRRQAQVLRTIVSSAHASDGLTVWLIGFGRRSTGQRAERADCNLSTGEALIIATARTAISPPPRHSRMQ